jgi:hypothetical protein
MRRKKGEHGRDAHGTKVEALQIMWSVFRKNGQVPNVQKSLPDQMVSIA